MNLADTIVAVSSAAGPAARMIVRASGPDAFALLQRVGVAHVPSPASAVRTFLNFAGITCPAWVYVFAGPRSYTGDDSVEWHLPGNPILTGLLLDTLLNAGARTAEPGEFTARAFLNGRLDLAAAEGVALTLAATHADELAAARRMLAGEVSRRIDAPMVALADVLALLESNLDFADEGISFVDLGVAAARVADVARDLDELLNAALLGRAAAVPTFALVGRPNAGKSTLLNALAGAPRAVASPVAGTTRDALSIDLSLSGGRVRVIDLAGLETPADDSAIEQDIAWQMQERARNAIDTADYLIEVHDPADPDRAWTARPADLRVWTKADTVDPQLVPSVGMAISAVVGTGIDALKSAMNALAFQRPRGDALTLTARQADAVARARDVLTRAPAAAAAGAELLADEIRTALNALGQIRGVMTPEDVLGRVFAGFCIGK